MRAKSIVNINGKTFQPNQEIPSCHKEWVDSHKGVHHLIIFEDNNKELPDAEKQKGGKSSNKDQAN